MSDIKFVSLCKLLGLVTLRTCALQTNNFETSRAAVFVYAVESETIHSILLDSVGSKAQDLSYSFNIRLT